MPRLEVRQGVDTVVIYPDVRIESGSSPELETLGVIRAHDNVTGQFIGSITLHETIQGVSGGLEAAGFRTDHDGQIETPFRYQNWRLLDEFIEI